MAPRFRFVVVVILCVLSATLLASYVSSKNTYANENRKKIVVEIDYGNIHPSRTIETSWVKGSSALEILQTVAEVKTYPVGEHVFVISIDGVEGRRGEMAWYYIVDGKSADKLAYSNILNGASHIKWEYKKDVCSEKVDKQK